MAVACATCRGALRPHAGSSAGQHACNGSSPAVPTTSNLLPPRPSIFTSQDVDALYVSHIQVNKAQKGRRRCVVGDPTFLCRLGCYLSFAMCACRCGDREARLPGSIA